MADEGCSSLLLRRFSPSAAWNISLLLTGKHSFPTDHECSQRHCRHQEQKQWIAGRSLWGRRACVVWCWGPGNAPAEKRDGAMQIRPVPIVTTRRSLILINDLVETASVSAVLPLSPGMERTGYLFAECIMAAQKCGRCRADGPIIARRRRFPALGVKKHNSGK